MSLFSCKVDSFSTPWAVTHHISMESPWDFPGKNAGVGCRFLLQGIFLTQGSNPGLLHCRQTLYRLSYQESPYKGLECKSRKSRNTWSNRQIRPWNMQSSRAKSNRVLPREHTGHSKHPLPATQEKTLHMDITRWSTLKSVSTNYILCSQRWRSSIQSAKTRLGADCDSDHELLIAKFRLKLKKVGKTTRPFSYDLNQIPYDGTVEVRNRLKGLDLIECLMNYGWRFVTL